MKGQVGAPSLGSRVGDRYTLERVLGNGAMGSVYEAHDGSGARFALKTLLAPPAKGDAAERRARFLREAAVCATIHHANVVPVLDHGIDGATDVPYLVMPLLEGEDLAAVLDRVRSLEPSVAIALVVQACAGLEAVHARGIVHRDVKPSNLFLENAGAEVVVKVTDFGLAKAFDATVMLAVNCVALFTVTGGVFTVIPEPKLTVETPCWKLVNSPSMTMLAVLPA